jgi:drug/metabolite transporter, DME family
MDKPDSDAKSTRTALSPLAVGTICGLLSAVGYTITNACLKQVADQSLNAFWVSSIKAFPTVLICAPWAFWQSQTAVRVVPAPRVFWLLFGAALIGQIGGNVGFQFGLQYVGMAISVAICLGTIQIFGAILGRIFLLEPITIRAVAAIVLLLGALAALTLGAESTKEKADQPPATQSASSNVAAIKKPPTSLDVAAGVLSLCVSGFSYAVVGVAIRYGVTGRTTIAFTLSVNGGVGFLCLGAIAFCQIGPSGIAGTTAQQWSAMLLAGFVNALSFLALTKAYQATTVTYVAIMNACQTAMAALVGALVFGEPWTASLSVGLILTAMGVTLMAFRRRQRPVLEEVVPEP